MRKILTAVVLFVALSAHAQCWKSVSLGTEFCVALKQDGTLWSWGDNTNGELGIGSTTNKSIPTRVGNDTDWELVSAGYGFTVALKTNGTMWVWGRNDFGLGNDPGNPTDRPSQVGNDSDWKFAAAGGAHILAIKNNGTLWGWGRNDSGQLGNGGYSNTNVPVQVGVATDWETAVLGNFHSLAIKTDQTLWSWGYNYHGQLGHGTAGFGAALNTPTQITTLVANQWKSIAAGSRHCMAITETGNLWVWGNNNSFALGLNDGSTHQAFPTRLGNATDWEMAAAGFDHAFATKADGKLWGWGKNANGQLGDGTLIDRSGPIQVDTQADWIVADQGLQHSAFLKNGDLYTSGSNDYGQLGIGSTTGHNTLQFVACPETLGVEDKEVTPFVCYPNPVREMLSIQNTSNLKIDHLDIVDATGKMVLQTSGNDGFPIDVGHLQDGLYVLKIGSGQTQHHVKLVKAK